MTWIPEKVTHQVDRFQVRKGTFETEIEAEQNADSQERPKFRRFTATIDTFRCSDCGRVHVAEMAAGKEENDPATPIEPEPCDHAHGERDPGPKNPWE